MSKPRIFLSSLVLFLPAVVLMNLKAPALEQTDTVPLKWQDFPSPNKLWPGKSGAIYYSVNLPNGSKANLIVVDYKSGNWKFKPLLNSKNLPTSVAASATTASAAVNGGYFDLKDGSSTSHVVIDGVKAADPSTNKSLISNPKLAPFLKEIDNRSEVRFLTDAHGQPAIDITPHSQPLPEGYKLNDSLQAGPQLLPKITAREEAFLRVNADGTTTDAISSAKPAARTAFGITPEGYAIVISVCGNKQDPESSGVTLQQLADTLKKLGCFKALNFDGGSSTTMFVRGMTSDSQIPATPPVGQVICGKTPETLVKSVLLLQAQ